MRSMFREKSPSETDSGTHKKPIYRSTFAEGYSRKRFQFNHHDWLDEEKGVALYWFWDDHGKTNEICAALGAGDFTPSQKGALARVAIHAHYEAQHANRLIHYARAKNANIWRLDHIKKLAFYSHHLIVQAVDFLESHGLIIHHKGKAGTLGKQSEFRATNRLILIIAKFSYEMLLPSDPLILRSSKKDPLSVPKNRNTDRMARRVDAQNRLIFATDFSVFPELKSPMRRIFREDFEHYGRFHAVGASWQNVRRKTRVLIELDGQKTTLLDFTACNPNIAYRLIGATPPENMYHSNTFCRADAKFALLILLNSKSRNKAIFTLAHDSRFSAGCNTDLLASRQYAKAIVLELEKLHAPLVEAKMFFGSGLLLMKAESDIADHIMTDLRNLGIVSLPIHDGFIVKEEHRSILAEAMSEHSKLGSNLSIPFDAEY